MSYLAIGAEEATPAISIEATLRAQQALLERIQRDTEKDLFFRKIATGAAIAGALFAAVRLTDIWLAVRRRRLEAAP
jgi:hypothetical protein